MSAYWIDPADTFELDPNKTRDLAPEALGADGRLKVLPAAFWAETTPSERALFGHRYGLYSFPTIELADHLQELLAGRTAIEIGAGHGVLARVLGIPATDNRMQEKPKYRRIFAVWGQPTVPYGPNVEEYDACDAVRKYQPDVVIGCWVTHRWNLQRPEFDGNEIGVDEEEIIANCGEYIAVGNEKTHAKKPIWKLPHSIHYPEYVYSRAYNGGRDFVAIWKGLKRDC